MATFSRKTVQLLLLAVVLFSVALRYPLVEHERHNDTYFSELLASSIKSKGYAVWTFHPLSYFGYYPASYPSGNFFLIAESSVMTGLGTSPTILVIGILSGILFALGSFSLSRVFLRRTEYSVLVAFLVTGAPRFVDTSYWSGSARAPFIVLAIVLMVLIVKAATLRSRSLYGFVPAMLFGCFALHHMAVLLILVGLAYVLSVLIHHAYATVATVRGGKRRAKIVALASISAGCITLVVFSVYHIGYFVRDLRYSFGASSSFWFEPESAAITLNLAISYTSQVGFVIVLAIVGTPLLIVGRRLVVELLFLIVIVILFLPLLPNGMYVTMWLAPFFSILGVAWISQMAENQKKKTVALLIVLLVISAALLPLFAVNRWNQMRDPSGATIVGDMQTFNDGRYLAQFENEACAISNVDVVHRRLAGVSGVVFLWSGVESALSGDVTRESIEMNIRWGEQKFPRNLYIWFDYEVTPSLDFLVIFFVIKGAEFSAGSADRLSTGEEYFDSHTRLLMIVDNSWSPNYVWIYGILSAKLPSQLFKGEWVESDGVTVHPISCYMIYRSEAISCFALEVPT